MGCVWGVCVCVWGGELKGTGEKKLLICKHLQGYA